MPEEFWNDVYRRLDVGAIDESGDLKAAIDHFGEVRGKRVLDLGCGLGTATLGPAKRGAVVTALDNSEVSIDKVRAYCEHAGIDTVSPIVASAMDIDTFGPFDLIYGSLILHHIEPFDQFVEVLRKALAPGGKAFFFENSARIGAPALWFREHLAGRLWFPKYGDDEEFPLTPAEVAQLRRHFHVEIVYPELILFRKISQYIFRWKVLPGVFNWLDRHCYRYPALRRLSYHQYLLLSQPTTPSAKSA